MKHLKKFDTFASQHIDEMAEITRKGKKAYVDGKLLKSSSIQDLSNNVALYHVKENNFLAQKGKFWLWLADTDEWVSKLKSGDYDVLFFPPRPRFNWNASPIDDIWKKSHQKNTRGAQHIIGVIEGFADEDNKKIIIEMMSVKPGFKRNRINSLMIDVLKDNSAFKDYKLVFEDPTEDGYLFMKQYAPDAEVEWTHNHRPPSWKKDHPEEAKPEPKIVQDQA